MSDNDETTVDRRELLARAIWGSVGAVAGIALLEQPALAADKKKFSIDVACLLNTFAAIPAPGATVPESNFRGTPFNVEGDIYPAGTIPLAPLVFDPHSATPLGHWFCRGWFINRTGRFTGPFPETDRPLPHVITHQEYLFGRITPAHLFPADQLTSSGLEGGIPPGDPPGVRSVVGGTGRFLGAQGQVLQHTTGLNTTGGPNFRFVFRLVDHFHAGGHEHD